MFSGIKGVKSMIKNVHRSEKTQDTLWALFSHSHFLDTFEVQGQVPLSTPQIELLIAEIMAQTNPLGR